MAPPPPEPVVAVAAPTTTTTALDPSAPAPAPAIENQPPPMTPALESQRSSPTPFLSKTYQIVDDPTIDDVISWNSEGSAFIVWRPVELARDLLPKYFKHSNFSSFVRQLNTYGFRKIATDRWEFANESFRRGEKRLLCDIHRRKIPISMVGATPPATAVPVVGLPSPANSGEEQVMSSSSSAMTGTDLLNENERLRRENEQLSHELSEMKSLCNNILSLMSNYAAKARTTTEAGPGLEAVELMPEAAAEQRHRLFGVSIGEKRIRSDGAEEEEEDPNKEMKRGLSDSDPIEGQDPRHWMLCCPPPANQ